MPPDQGFSVCQGFPADTNYGRSSDWGKTPIGPQGINTAHTLNTVMDRVDNFAVFMVVL